MAIDTEQRAPASGQNGESPEESLTGRGTYKTLDEQHGRLSPAEERFERQRRTIGLFLGPIVLAAMLLIPFDLDGNQHRLAAILAFVVVWWVTEAIPIPMTALLGVVLCALLEATPPPPEGDSSVDVVFGLFTDDTVMLFIGSFIIAQAMVVHGLHRRLAYRVLSLSWVGGNTYRIILAFGLIGAITSPVMSNTAGAAMMLPIGLGVMGVVGGMVANQARGEQRVERLRFGAALMLVITYGITVGGLLLPIGSPPNLIGRELLETETGEPITFFEWFLMALPIVLVMFVAVVVIVLAFNRPEVKEVEGVEEYVREERGKLGRLSRGERNTLLVLAFALIGWFLPGLVGIVAGDDSNAYTQVEEASNEGIVAILAATLLFVLPVDWKKRKFTLNWNQASQIDWGTVILFGGGLVLGSLLSQTGLAEVVGTRCPTRSACRACSASRS
jgi:solute carrier family 13 (sodium-dependent dicarboxylate transporter), member 2/3/5